MRELVRCVGTRKQLIAVAERDTAHGGLTDAEARQQCVDSGAKFDGWGFDAASVPTPAALADALLGPADASPRVFNRADGRGKLTAARFEDAVADTAPIVYERVGAFQQTMLRLIVQRLVPTREIYLPRELGTARRRPLPPPKGRFHL